MNYKSRILWTEILMWGAISLIVLEFIARIFFWQHVREAEDKFVAWLGISPDIHEILKFVVAILCLGYMFSRYGPFGRRP